MIDPAFLWEWVSFAVRWLHVITAIAWIGSSFYFIALDLGLNRNVPGPADGEEWQVHGGGFYHIQKYMVAPENMPEHLIWFKWESYATWLSRRGAAGHRLLVGGRALPDRRRKGRTRDLAGRTDFGRVAGGRLAALRLALQEPVGRASDHADADFSS